MLLGEDYPISPENIDEDGYIEHYGCGEEEITSSPWGWSVFDGRGDSVRGYIEEIQIDDS